MPTIEGPSTKEIAMNDVGTVADREVRDFGGVRIGFATPADEIFNDSRIRIGRVNSDGMAIDHAGVRIGIARPHGA
ncbi:hypothetical protein [Pseudonocardia sp. T1-2H]|uniref:hypothetical protein n=1 Tax=Pseudonocardia sp. T1-2H TaxID=3128899 RepID=UPI0031010C33